MHLFFNPLEWETFNSMLETWNIRSFNKVLLHLFQTVLFKSFLIKTFIIFCWIMIMNDKIFYKKFFNRINCFFFGFVRFTSMNLQWKCRIERWHKKLHWRKIQHLPFENQMNLDSFLLNEYLHIRGPRINNIFGKYTSNYAHWFRILHLTGHHKGHILLHHCLSVLA